MTHPASEVAEIARGLSDGRRAAVRLMPAWGLPMGHNAWPDLEYFNPDDEPVCSGEDVDAIIRLGLVDVGERQEGQGQHLFGPEYDVEAAFQLDLSPTGLLVRAHLAAEGVGG